nr:tms1 protein - mouse [Mus musculus]
MLFACALLALLGLATSCSFICPAVSGGPCHPSALAAWGTQFATW